MRLAKKGIYVWKKEGFMNLIKKIYMTVNYLIGWKKQQSLLPNIIQLRKDKHPDIPIKDQLILSETPDVSIIIPVYNHLDDTIRCLNSIILANVKTKYEVIIADDASTDKSISALSQDYGLRYVRNDNNLGFLRNCNNAAKLSRGKYIMFLNNDVVVQPHWLDRIIETFSSFPETGLVGSKFLYPNGILQEAGGVIWKDGSGLNYGRGDDPRKPQYNYMREVDYCSGACIVILRSLWQKLSGFDDLFAPAYYEDTDLAFRVRQEGYNVIYQPLSQVFHLEGATSGTDINTGVKQFQKKNQHTFVSRWKDIIETHGMFWETEEISYRNRYRKLTALVIDAQTPTPDQDSGSIDTINILKMLRELGFNVSFIPDDLFHFGRYTEDLQRIGIECQYAPFIKSIEEYIRNEGKHLDLVILFRAPIAGKYINLVRDYAPRARIIFSTVDLHFLREERAAEITRNVDLGNVGELRDLEFSIMHKADQTIIVSEFEQKIISDENENIKTTVIPLQRDMPGRSNGFEKRRNILFLGGFDHTPNIDAVVYFVEQIWPLINLHLPKCKFLIAGSNMPHGIKKLEDEYIKILGHVEDLSDLFSRCKLSVAPLRYGAGVKGKVVSSLSYGTPCVATPIATEGTGLVNGVHISEADTPEKFANAVADVYSSPILWNNLSRKGFEFVRARHGYNPVKRRFRALLQELELELE